MGLPQILRNSSLSFGLNVYNVNGVNQNGEKEFLEFLNRMR
jgi:hypothetical protein